MDNFNFEFLNTEYLINHNCQIFTYFLIIIKSRYKVYGNKTIDDLIEKYKKELGIFIPENIQFGNGVTMANVFLKKAISDSGYNLRELSREEDSFATINDILDCKIEEILNLYPRQKLFVNLLMFSSFLSVLSQSKKIKVSNKPSNDFERLILLI